LLSFGSATGSLDEGNRIGQLALALNEKFKTIGRPYLARTRSLYYECVDSWKNPVKLALDPLNEAYHVGIETGDVEFAFICFNYKWVCQFPMTPLRQLADQMHDYSRRMEHHGMGGMDQCGIRSLWQAVLNLMGLAADAKTLEGEVFGLAQLEVFVRLRGSFGYSLTCYPRCMIAYLFGDYELAFKFAKGSREISSQNLSPIMNSRALLFDGLTDVAMCRNKKHRRATRAAKLSKLLQRWSSRAPYNFLALHLLLDAELASLCSSESGAHRKYVGAIAMAKDTGSLLDTALSNELCGKYLVERKDQYAAESYFRDAIRCYTDWGASAKAKHLANELKIYSFESLRGLEV